MGFPQFVRRTGINKTYVEVLGVEDETRVFEPELGEVVVDLRIVSTSKAPPLKTNLPVHADICCDNLPLERETGKLIAEERLPDCAGTAIASDDIVRVDFLTAFRGLDVHPSLVFVLAGSDDSVFPADLAIVFSQVLVQHQLVQLVQHQASHAQVLAVDVGQHLRVHAGDPAVVLEAAPAHRGRRHPAASHLVDDAGPPEIGDGCRPVYGRPWLLVQLVRRFEDLVGYAVFRQQQREQQPRGAGADNNYLAPSWSAIVPKTRMK